MKKKTVKYFKKSELENIIQMIDGNGLNDNEDLNVHPCLMNKKLRSKIKQRLGTVELGVNLNASVSRQRYF